MKYTHIQKFTTVIICSRLIGFYNSMVTIIALDLVTTFY